MCPFRFGNSAPTYPAAVPGVISLQKQKPISLTKCFPGLTQAKGGLAWDTTADLDAALFMLDARGKCASTADFMAEMTQSDFENEIILVKGAPEFEFKQIIDMLEAKQHQTVLQVNLDAVAHNYNFFRSKLRPDTKIV